MIKKTCEVYHSFGKKVLVVLNVGGVIETASWNSLPDGILLAWQGGQEGGNSVVDILKGKVNPSGKLPMTFPINLSDHGSSANFPLGVESSLTHFLIGSMVSNDEQKPKEEQVKNIDYTLYQEDIYVGYRYFDKKNIDVSYPFGYGLSYTDFEFSELETKIENDTVKINLKVSNIGKIPGKEVVQIYTSKLDAKIDRPLKELRSFKKTPVLSPGETKEINLYIPVSEISYWDEENLDWKIEKGLYKILAASSSRNIQLVDEISFDY
jgi:beta-glucosidase